MSRDLFFKYGFEFYGQAGKGLICAIIALLLLIWRKQSFPKLEEWRFRNLLWLPVLAFALILEWLIIDRIAQPHPGILWPLAAHICIAILLTLLLCFSFGIQNIRIIVRTYRRELMIAAGLWLAFTVFLYVVYGCWTVLASIVLNSVQGLFHIIGITAIYIPPQSLLFSKFQISIAQGCSGIESITLFTGLYVLIGVLDWQRLNHKKYLLVFIPALLLLFGINILRVFVLILAGYYLNPEIAFSTFHTYAGMIFFILYSMLFWAVSYRWMLVKNPDSKAMPNKAR